MNKLAVISLCFVFFVFVKKSESSVYIGCFEDKGVRDLPRHLSQNSRMNIQSCISDCKNANYIYAGLQNANQCFCGNAYGRYEKVQNTQCNKKCLGKKTEICGATWRNSIYSTTEYVGCFIDTGKRDLPKFIAQNSRMSIGQCKTLCGNDNYKYAGVQNSNQCFCGNSFGRHGHAPTSSCNAACTGNNKEKCGGFWRNSIYESLPKQNVITSDYIGCYIDKPKRDLSQKIISNSKMTIQQCKAHCQKNGYKYAGAQHYDQCFCGNSFGRYGYAKSSECNTPCKGNPRQKCGGTWRNAIYALTNDFGCFKDYPTRDLSKKSTSNNLMTISSCATFCSANGYNFAGVQHFDQCFCRNSFGRYGLAKSSECNTPCKGNNAEKCGGTWRNAVYKTPTKQHVIVSDYIGCYKDEGKRDLPSKFFSNSKMTVQLCKDYCLIHGYKFAGVQHFDQCFCGNSFGRYGYIKGSECNTPCKGNPGQKCGGTWRNAIYATSAYYGCFKDWPTRDLSKNIITNSGMTVQNCRIHCRKSGFKFAGVQHSNQCFCGNSFGRYGKANPSDCNTSCTGSNSEKCGGTWRNYVYASDSNC